MRPPRRSADLIRSGHLSGHKWWKQTLLNRALVLGLCMRYFSSLAILLLFGCDRAPLAESASPAFEELRTFAGKLEGNWEHVGFRECGTPENCSKSFADCGVEVAETARKDWAHLRSDENYWLEFIGRRRAASSAEARDNLDPHECVIEVQRLLRACESSSPIYPDESGQRPSCASALKPAMFKRQGRTPQQRP